MDFFKPSKLKTIVAIIVVAALAYAFFWFQFMETYDGAEEEGLSCITTAPLYSVTESIGLH